MSRVPQPSLKESLAWLLGFRFRYVVRGQSMEPLLSERQQVLVRPYSDRAGVAVGDIILATHPFIPSKVIIKRVAQHEPKNNSFFVEGANAAASTDSRSFGWVPADRVLGVVTAAL